VCRGQGAGGRKCDVGRREFLVTRLRVALLGAGTAYSATLKTELVHYSGE
jgi:hypothetical protein